MSDGTPKIPASRIVVVMPNWLGDGVMATPFLRALRALYPNAHIAAVTRPLVAPVLAGLGVDSTTKTPRHQEWMDEVKVYQRGEEGQVVRWLKAGRFELGILLPNSFRSAWMLWRGGVKRRLGYARGGRSLLLTDRLATDKRSAAQRKMDVQKTAAIRMAGGGRVRVGSNYQPTPVIDYYLGLSLYLSASTATSNRPVHVSYEEQCVELGVLDSERSQANDALSHLEVGAHDNFIVMVPGANFGSSKCWMPDRFAKLADRMSDPNGPHKAVVLIASTSREMPIVDAILNSRQGSGKVCALARLNDGKGISVGALKEIVRRSRLMICNDTGPRHLAAAFNVPTVTLFGPTDPVWAETFSTRERIVRVDVPCGPCQLKQCPIDHRCMKGISVEMVMSAIDELWPRETAAGGSGAGDTGP